MNFISSVPRILGSLGWKWFCSWQGWPFEVSRGGHSFGLQWDWCVPQCLTRCHVAKNFGGAEEWTRYLYGLSWPPWISSFYLRVICIVCIKIIKVKIVKLVKLGCTPMVSHRSWLQAAFAEIMKRLRDPWLVIEQPKGSWMLRLPFVLALISAFGLRRYLTYLCFFGHDLEKPTTLVGDLPGLESLERKMTQSDRQKYRLQRQRKNLRLKKPKVYYTKKGGKVTGTKLLAASALYPTRFCSRLVMLWIVASQQCRLQR